MQLTQIFIVTLLLGCIDVLAEEYKFVKNDQPGSKITAKLSKGTIWYWCKFDSMKKLTYSFSANTSVTTYTTPQSLLKGVSVLPGSIQYRAESGSRCSEVKGCSRTVGGGILSYTRCLAVRFDDVNITMRGVQVTIQAKETEDSRVIGAIIGAALAGVLLCCCISWLLCCCMRRCCGGKRKKMQAFGSATV